MNDPIAVEERRFQLRVQLVFREIGGTDLPKSSREAAVCESPARLSVCEYWAADF